jgi:hypothetical protein
VYTAEEILLVKTERVRLASRLTSSGMTVAGLVVEESQPLASAFNGVAAPRPGRADQRTGNSRPVRRSRGQRSTRTGSRWDLGTAVAAADGFNQPPDVG